TRHSQTAREKPLLSPKKTTSDSELVFIDGFSTQRNGKSATERIKTSSPNGTHVLKGPDEATDLQKQFSVFLEVMPSKVIYKPALWGFIDKWWGVPYRYGGITRNGIDCSAFVQKLYKKVFNINSLPRTAQQQYNDVKKIKHIKDLRPGDLVFFKINSRRVSHVGVYLQNYKFVNASLSSGVTISDLTNRYWKRYYVGGGRLKEVGDGIMLISAKELQ